MRPLIGFLVVALAIVAAWTPPQYAAQNPAASLRIVTRDGTRTMPLVSVNNQDYVALDDVASAFGLAIKEDKLAGGITVAAGSRTVIITPDQPVVSVAGRLVSLTAPPLRQATRWLVPLDFLQRALGPVLDTRIDVRRSSRMVVVGDLRVPRVTVRVDATAAGVTTHFEISPATPSRVTSDGGRLVVNFEADALELQTPALPPQEFLQAVQPGDSPSSVRLVPGPRFGVHRATTSQADASSSRLSIELLPAGADAPAPPTSTPATPPPATPPADPLPLPVPVTGLRTVVIDPGHGGDEQGARGPGGTLEKDITLQVSRRLRTTIESRLGLRVFLTRDDDRTMSLDDRSAYANSQKADVFLSIHANAALRPAMKGAEVYYLSVDRADLEARRVAESTDTVLPTLGGGTRAIDLILWETAQARYLEQSAALANLIEQALRNRVEMSPRAVQQAPFRVLVGATMPAALVEIGYISNPEQEQALTSAAYQDQVVQSLFDALVQFRAFLERSNARPPQ